MASDMDIHLTEEDLRGNQQNTDLFCDVCSRAFKNPNAFRMHRVKTHNDVSSESDSRLRHRHVNPEKGIKKRYFCPVLGCRYNGNSDYFVAFKLLKQHYMKVHEKKVFSCEKCGTAKYSLQRDLNYHRKHTCLFKEESCAGTSNISTFQRKMKENPLPVAQVGSDPIVDQLPNKRNKTKTSVTKIYILNAQPNPFNAQYIPIMPKKAVRSVASQTTFEFIPDLAERCAQKVSGSTDHEVGKDVATNVTSTDFRSVNLQTSLPPIDSITFQPCQRYEQSDFYCQTGFSYASQSSTASQQSGMAPQSYSCGVSQNDCAVQSTMACVPETRHVETHIDDLDFEEIWRHIETQTSESFGNDALTQTVNDFMDCGIMTDDGPCQTWTNYPLSK